MDSPTPPFRLTVDTTEALLSADLQIHIVYGGNQMETYQPGERSSSPDICCATFEADATFPERVPCGGEDSSVATERAVVVCDLWTGGAANLTIRSSHQVYASQTLQAVPRLDIPERCGLFETLNAHWTYGLPDAGVAIGN